MSCYFVLCTESDSIQYCPPLWWPSLIMNTLRLRQDGCIFPDAIFKWVVFNKKCYILIQISFKYIPKGPINNNPALVHKTAWRQPDDMPISEPAMVRLLIHIYISRPQWFNWLKRYQQCRATIIALYLLEQINWINNKLVSETRLFSS